MIQSQPAALRRAIRPCDRQSSLRSRSKEQLDKTNRHKRAGRSGGRRSARIRPLHGVGPRVNLYLRGGCRRQCRLHLA